MPRLKGGLFSRGKDSKQIHNSFPTIRIFEVRFLMKGERSQVAKKAARKDFFGQLLFLKLADRINR